MDQLCYNVFLKRCWTVSDILLLLTHWWLTEPEPTILSQFKTNKNKIKIEVDGSGNPKILSISVADSYNAKALQAMLWDYCTIHIHAFQDILHKHHVLMYDT